MTTIYFIRHGQASFGAESYDQLSPNGELQAKILGQYFDQILKEAPVVVSGSMQRHQQTACISLAECFPEVDVLTNLAKIFEGAIERWTGGDYHHEYDESWPEFKSRIEVALQDLCDELAQSKPRYAVVFTSGGVISVVAGKLLGLSPNKTFALNWAIANSSMTTLRLVGNEPQLLSLNEHHFIKAENSNLLTWI